MFQQPNVCFLFGLSTGRFYSSCLNHKSDLVFAPSAPTWPYFLLTFSNRRPQPSYLCSGVGVRGTARHVKSLTRGNDQTQNLKMTSVVFLPPPSDWRLEAVVGLSHPHRRHVWTGAPCRGEPAVRLKRDGIMRRYGDNKAFCPHS